MNKQDFKNYIRQFDFTRLFNELGWDYLNEQIPRRIDDENFEFLSIAHKAGFRIMVCTTGQPGKLPFYDRRKKIHTEISKLYYENLIIFTDAAHTVQCWQFIDHQPNKPNQFRQTTWHIHQDPEMLYQRLSGIIFTLEEQEIITIVDVAQRVRANFAANAERVTKRFYDQFKQEHTRFLAFIQGITETVDKDWYASLMLNRLMFCYFIQKKGFLDNDLNYLRNKLNETGRNRGCDHFYSFYRNFLLVLFHKGLGAQERPVEIEAELGKVPYLNGGLFDVHELERTYQQISISDEAFEHIFNFFDQYNWHLDTRVTATGRDINPDVIGYIFEKYINDRAQMGAYYTKEDITDYISKNCIIPYLFDEVKRNYPNPLQPEGHIWQMLKSSGDTYIYDAVKKGVDLPLPEEIAIGLDTIQTGLLERRKAWNKPAPAEYALPTEIWREVVERRNRYREIKSKIENGAITEIHDFITYNLNIRQFAQDLIENTDDPVLIRHLYHALTDVTILDPTCGSGAFLFAAMNILETLYESSIERMESFVAESGKGKYKFFETVMEQVTRPGHPNLPYFIYKNIILNNLYGVDIMEEAVEIAKLRLFLKLMATVEPDYTRPNLGLEPLPDVDFNIRCGNTLVGFGTEAELKNGLDYTFEGVMMKPVIEEKCEVVALAFKRFKEIQLEHGDENVDFKEAKEDLNLRLKELNGELNHLLHQQYTGIPFEQWLRNYQPFHWFAEFYEIIRERSGFDVIIGNPPYVEIKEAEKTYKIINESIKVGGNLHSIISSRSLFLLNKNGIIGLIVPVAISNTERMQELRRRLVNLGPVWVTNYAIRPGKLFSGAEQRLSILINS